MKIRDLIGEAPLNTNDPKKGLFTRKTWDQSQDAISGAGDAFAKGFGIGGPGPKQQHGVKKIMNLEKLGVVVQAKMVAKSNLKHNLKHNLKLQIR